ncbi:MAG: CPBP family intramembrane metalloprotease [Cyanobacteria bacterium]|nr:CPBP family intramembrane metalloprotease [Cyanobacteriota bacterium]
MTIIRLLVVGQFVPFRVLVEALGQIALFLLVWILLWLPIAIPLALKLQWRPFQASTPAQKLPLLIPLYLLAPILLGFAVWRSPLPWSAYGWTGLHSCLIAVPLGLAISVAGLTLVSVIRAQLGWVAWAPPEQGDGGMGWQTGATVLGLLVLGLGLGGVEEWVFRGWMQTQLQVGLGVWGAAAIASTIFALAHLLWDGPVGWWQQPGLWLLGFVLVMARWVDQGSIGLAWGLHSGWIWGLACLDAVFGATPTGQGPRWLVGRDQQPLTGLLDMGLLVGTGLLVIGLWPKVLNLL